MTLREKQSVLKLGNRRNRSVVNRVEAMSQRVYKLRDQLPLECLSLRAELTRTALHLAVLAGSYARETACIRS